jgi:DNA-binding transcriptional MerR regulator
VRIAELSRRSGVSVPTIKFYLREGLLAPGLPLGPNQANYDEAHLARLRMIRALIAVGGLSVAATRDVLTAIDQPEIGSHATLGAAHRAIEPSRRPRRTDERWQGARDEVAAFVARRGWLVAPDAPAIDRLADVIEALHALELPQLLSLLDVYADAAESVARHDVRAVAERAATAEQSAGSSTALMVETVVAGTVLGEAMLSALRRLAQEDASARQFLPAVKDSQESAGSGSTSSRSVAKRSARATSVARAMHSVRGKPAPSGEGT